jgi:hypothetical protein
MRFTLLLAVTLLLATTPHAHAQDAKAQAEQQLIAMTFPPSIRTDEILELALQPLPSTFSENARIIKHEAYVLLKKRLESGQNNAIIQAKTEAILHDWQSIHIGDDWMRTPIARLLIELPVEERYLALFVKDILPNITYYPKNPEVAHLLGILENHPSQASTIITELAPILPKLSYQAPYIRALIDLFQPYSASASQASLDALVKARMGLKTAVQQQFDQIQQSRSANSIWDTASAQEVDALFTALDAIICSKPPENQPTAKTWEYLIAPLSYPVASSKASNIEKITCAAP